MEAMHDEQIPKPGTLSLRLLNEQITQHYPKRPAELDSPAQIFAMSAIFVSLGASLISAFFLPAAWAKVGVLLSMIVEVLAAIVYVVLVVRSWDRDKMKDRFASELDNDYRAQAVVVDWIRTHDQRLISSMLRFVQARLASLSRRAGVLVGSMEKLGGLPVAVALFFQFKDFQITWPLSINWSAWVLSLLVIGLYVVGLYAQSLKFRLHLYEHLLGEALHEDADARIAVR